MLRRHRSTTRWGRSRARRERRYVRMRRIGIGRRRRAFFAGWKRTRCAPTRRGPLSERYYRAALASAGSRRSRRRVARAHSAQAAMQRHLAKRPLCKATSSAADWKPRTVMLAKDGLTPKPIYDRLKLEMPSYWAMRAIWRRWSKPTGRANVVDRPVAVVPRRRSSEGTRLESNPSAFEANRNRPELARRSTVDLRLPRRALKLGSGAGADAPQSRAHSRSSSQQPPAGPPLDSAVALAGRASSRLPGRRSSRQWRWRRRAAGAAAAGQRAQRAASGGPRSSHAVRRSVLVAAVGHAVLVQVRRVAALLHFQLDRRDLVLHHFHLHADRLGVRRPRDELVLAGGHVREPVEPSPPARV